MARMPTRDDLPQAVAQANTTIVRAPQDTLGTSLRGLSGELAYTSRVLARQAEEDRKKQTVMEKARATAFLQQSLMEGESQYTLENKPDFNKWGDEYTKGASSWRTKAGEFISDPNERELFLLQSQDDVMRHSLRVAEKARTISDTRRSEELKVSMEQIVDLAAAAKNEEERAALFTKMRDLGKQGVDAGFWSPAYMADYDVKARRKVAGLKVEQAILDDPATAYGMLSDQPYEGLVQKIGVRENAKRDPKARPRDREGNLLSSALGYFQFTHETWEGLRKKYPKLGLTKSFGKTDNDLDGRLDLEQNLKALKALTQENAQFLRSNGFAPSEANLYLTHLMGGPKAIEMLQADPTAPAERLFPKEAEANARHFSGKTVEGAILSITKGLSGAPMERGPEFASLSEEQKLIYLKQAKAAAEADFNKGRDEWELEATAAIADVASEMTNLEDALSYVRDAEASTKVRLDAERLVETRFRQKEAQREENRKQQWQQTYKAVQDGMDQGVDRAELLKMATQLTDQNDRASLTKFIYDGPPRTNDQQLLNRIDTLRYGNAEAQKKFMEMDLTTPEMLSGLTSELRGQLFAQQQAAKKAQLPDGSAPQLTTMASIRDSYPVQLGLTVKGAKADPEDVATWSVIEGDIQQRLDLFYQTNKRPPNQTEVRDIADEAIIQWHQSVKTGGFKGFFQDDTPTAKAISDRYEAMPAKNKQPLSAIWQRYVADLQAHNQQNGKNLQPSPTFFMENYLK